ncbi:SDR family oxidoreductase [Paenibacillus sp. S150]|uniref:SDR family NAD(P)-dependent oxidoreductase n=1 Tax=Paenibacillus sp. S150 TaxID=2749826 RepID=UPI001C59CEF8|nr:SDR family oxidoreductase [Paenibacillus sp. S150]MBW4084447.1 SDR family oxidoreductase [Paenibacillus sp. S150]
MARSSITEKIIVITGGASDIGQSIAMELIQNRNKVILLDINESGLQNVQALLNPTGDVLMTQAVDMTIPGEVEQAFNTLYSKYKKIDYVFNIVGYGLVGEVRDMGIEDWRGMINTNLNGVLFPTVYAYDLMTKQGFGHIVNMSSLGGIIPSPFNTAYSTTKHAIVGLSTSLREEGKSRGVKVTVLCPGGIRTKLWDSVRLINLKREPFRKLVPESSLLVPKQAAKIILRHVAKNKGIIVFPKFATLSYFVYKYIPGLFNKGIQISVKSLRAIQEEKR